MAQFDGVLDAARHRIGMHAHQAEVLAAAQLGTTPYTLLFKPFGPMLAEQNLRLARTQSGLDMANLACVLERHLLDRGGYPDSLAALVPVYLPAVPVDVLEGHALRYSAQGRDGDRL